VATSKDFHSKTEIGVLADSVRMFATILSAYKECGGEIRAVVDEMVAIIGSSESSEEERDLATETVVEALFPALTAEIREQNAGFLTSPEGRKIRSELASEEETFASRLAAKMRERGLKQEDLADKTGVGQSAISMMLNRQCRPQRRTVERMAEALGVRPEELWPGPAGH
jgi:lambda repressor-like predicted transcriptional regulator